MGWKLDARAAAREAGIDPVLFQALVWQESRGRPDAQSPVGAYGYTQLMPATARELGVDPRDPQQNLLGGARYLKQQLDRFGGDQRKALAAYNAGPGNVQKYGGIPPFAETQGYVRNILGSLDQFSAGPASGAPRQQQATPAPESAAPQAGPSASPSFGPAASLAPLVSQLMSGGFQQRPTSGGLPAPSFATRPAMAGQIPVGGGGPAKRADISALIDATRTPGQAVANVQAQSSPLVADASSAPRSAPSNATGGAAAALGWAESKIGSKEATGNNDGPLASYLNKRFGMSNQPWCAMFTSAAVTKGGAPASARTASVRDVRTMAEQGGGGYQKGFISGSRAKAGDLILFGNDHIGMVKSVKNGKVTFVGGNQSNAVTERTVDVGAGDIVRPLYGRR